MNNLSKIALIIVAVLMFVGCESSKRQNGCSIVIEGDKEALARAVVTNAKKLDIKSFKENDNSIGQKVSSGGTNLFSYSIINDNNNYKLEINSSVPVKIICEDMWFLVDGVTKEKIVTVRGKRLFKLVK